MLLHIDVSIRAIANREIKFILNPAPNQHSSVHYKLLKEKKYAAINTPYDSNTIPGRTQEDILCIS